MRQRVGRLVEWLEKRIGFLTFLAVIVTIYGVFKASNDAETQRFNTAWVLVNSSRQASPFSANGGGQVDGGGRKQALDYLRDNHQSLQGADLSQAILSYASLDGMDLNRTTMIYTDLFGSDLRAASLWSAIMTDANLQFATLQGADLDHAHLKCADLRGAHLEPLPKDAYLKEKRWERLMRFELFWFWKIHDMVRNEYLTHQEQRDVPTNLTDADLSAAHLQGADLTRAILVNATLKNAHLENYKDKFEATTGCHRKAGGLLGLYWHDPYKEPSLGDICHWTSTHPTSKTHIKPAFSCKDGDKPATNLRGANLTGANLTGAHLQGADLTDANLTGVIGLTPEQIADARLCNTILPSYIPPKMVTQICPPANAGDHKPAQSNTLPNICKNGQQTLCQFALAHADIQHYCEQSSVWFYPSAAPDEYIGCLTTQSILFKKQQETQLQASNKQPEINEIYRSINIFGAEKTVDIQQLYQNPFPFKGKTIAVIGSWDRFVSETEALFVGKYGTIIITDAPTDTMESGTCILVGMATGMKSIPGLGLIPGLGSVSLSNIDFVGQKCGLSDQIVDELTTDTSH